MLRPLMVNRAQAAATLGSNALGAGDADTAKRLVPLAYGCCLLCGVLQGGVVSWEPAPHHSNVFFKTFLG